MIHTVILDLDGPLLDGRERHYACYREILEEHGASPLAMTRYWALKRNGAEARVQLAASGAEELEESFRAEWLARIEQPRLLALDRLQPDVMQKLQSWKRRGLRLVLATQRHDRAALADQLARLGLQACFDIVVSCETSDKAAAVREACPGLDPSGCVWIGDTEADVKAARTLGCTVWSVACGLRSKSFLSALKPDQLFEDVASVAL